MVEASVDGTWSHEAIVMPGKCYWARYGEFAEYKYMKFRVAYVEGNNVGIEYVLTNQTSDGPNKNCNYAFLKDYPAAMELEMPAINEVDGIYREHYVDYAGQHIMNLATLWNAKLRHSSWVAFYFDKVTSLDNVKRTDAWGWDSTYDLLLWVVWKKLTTKTMDLTKGISVPARTVYIVRRLTNRPSITPTSLHK